MPPLESAHECLLVVAPNTRLHEPHLGVSLLKAALERGGVRTGVYYANAHLAQVSGLWVHQLVTVDCMLDAVCSPLVFQRPTNDVVRLAVDLARAGFLPDLHRNRRPHETFFGLVRAIARFRDLAVRRILESGARIVGFSSVFSDRLFCIAAAREIRKAAAHIRIVVGGPNCDGEMGEELLAAFPEIDYVCQGYAETSLVDLAHALIPDGRLYEPIPGVLSRESAGEPAQRALPLTAAEYEALPDPDFRDFFAQIREAFAARGLLRRRGCAVELAGISPRFRRGMPWLWALNRFPSVPLETCRGCWWSRGTEDRRCAFCGDMQAAQPHLQKRPEIALDQVRRISKKYHPATVYLTDRLASPELAHGFWDRLAADGGNLQFSTEATGAMSRESVQRLGRAGARIVQLGIESFDPSDLRAMGKPTTLIHNVATLKYFAEFGVWPFWGYLGPTPGSKASDPIRAATVIDSVAHLAPPFPPGLKPIAIFRFSKYFNDPEAYGLGRLPPLPILKGIYPLPDESLRRLAHGFAAEHAPSADMTAVRRALSEWARDHWRSHLIFVATTNGGWLIDTRPCRTAILRRLNRLESAVYEFCKVPRSLTAICSRLGLEGTAAARILAGFAQSRTVLDDGRLYLSLGVEPSHEYRWLRQAVFADLHSRFPLAEVLTLKTEMCLPRSAASFAVRQAIAAKLARSFLTLRWELARMAACLLASALRIGDPRRVASIFRSSARRRGQGRRGGPSEERRALPSSDEVRQPADWTGRK